MKKILSSIIFLAITFCAFGQYDAVEKTKRPNIPGTFMIDLGINQAINAPETWNQGWWGSRTVNIYYQYSLRFGRSKFSLNPGIGLSLERWKFKDNFTLIDTVELDSYPNGPASANQVEQYNLVNPKVRYPAFADKSMLVANYVEIPIEVRFDTKPEDISRSFNVAIGGRIGFLYDSFTKVKFDYNDETVKDKYKSNTGLNSIRYGVYTRIGVGSFTLFTFYNISDLFEKGKGPLGESFNTFTYGISINGF